AGRASPARGSVTATRLPSGRREVRLLDGRPSPGREVDRCSGRAGVDSDLRPRRGLYLHAAGRAEHGRDAGAAAKGAALRQWTVGTVVVRRRGGRLRAVDAPAFLALRQYGDDRRTGGDVPAASAFHRDRRANAGRNEGDQGPRPARANGDPGGVIGRAAAMPPLSG